MGIKRPFSSRMLMSGYDLGAEPIADVMNPPWKYVNRINESGYEVRTLYHYNNAYGGEEVTVPYGYTELQDYQSSTNNSPSTLPFYFHNKLISVDLNHVPFRNNSMYRALSFCNNLVTVTNIPKNITNMDYAFEAYFYAYRGKLNCPITIPNSVTSMVNTFEGQSDFNYPITIPNSVTNMYGTFTNCRLLNQPITIGSNVTNMSSTFYYCSNFNQPVTIPNSVTSMSSTFSSCSNLGGEGIAINILSTEITNVINAFYKCASNLRRNVYTYFTYANGENTKTYNSLKSAGYTTTGKGNTYLMDLGPAPW